MRFLVDECTGPKVAQWLRDQGHEVFSVYDEARGLDDSRPSNSPKSKEPSSDGTSPAP